MSSLGQSKRSPGDALNYAARAPLAEDNNATELLAVFVALVRHPRRSPITIRTDSRATLDVLERLARGDGLRAFKFKGARGAASCRATLFWLRAVLFWREAATAVRKVKAHAAATPDNATADALAAQLDKAEGLAETRKRSDSQGTAFPGPGRALENARRLADRRLRPVRHPAGVARREDRK